MRTTKVILVDDIDGSEEDVRTVTFALENRLYEVDLSPANAEALEAALRPYLDAGRPVKRRKRQPKAA
ncbi:Lsr2 family protein [Microbacterium sp. LMI12-1-1.1]|uniref:Lsr2 dimerization domain-containing protein n=1 Tax=Microbacterium sp. LMI12-1-1.1 TaxID=3135225 RepID=UPI00344AAC3D